MAARKSCTHLTWAEAKNKSGITSAGVKKNKEYLRKQNHGQLQAQKIISKHGGDDAETRKLQKAYRKLDEKSAALTAQREEEKERKRLEAMQEVRPYDRAKQKFADLMIQKRTKDQLANDIIPQPISPSIDSAEMVSKVVECRRMQLDEIIALEALIAEDYLALSSSSEVTRLREKLDELDAGIDSMAGDIANHPHLSLFIQLEVDGSLSTMSEDSTELNALIIVEVTLPPLYLNIDDGPSVVPLWTFHHVMVTDKDVFCSADKPLESLAWLDEKAIGQAMTQYAQEELLPYPCIYEVAVSWLTEHFFEYLNLHPHLSLIDAK
jgi:hypothetical protein